MNDILLNILYIVLSAAISFGGALLARWIKTNTDIKYRDEIAEAVTTAVTYIQQVYVDKAKANNGFEIKNQKEALNLAIESAQALLSAGAINYLHRNRTDSEVKDYLTALIEEAVRVLKKGE